MSLFKKKANWRDTAEKYKAIETECETMFNTEVANLSTTHNAKLKQLEEDFQAGVDEIHKKVARHMRSKLLEIE